MLFRVWFKRLPNFKNPRVVTKYLGCFFQERDRLPEEVLWCNICMTLVTSCTVVSCAWVLSTFSMLHQGPWVPEMKVEVVVVIVVVMPSKRERKKKRKRRRMEKRWRKRTPPPQKKKQKDRGVGRRGGEGGAGLFSAGKSFFSQPKNSRNLHLKDVRTCSKSGPGINKGAWTSNEPVLKCSVFPPDLRFWCGPRINP